MNYFSIDDKNGQFKGFIQSLNLNLAKKEIKKINTKYKVTACIKENLDRGTYERWR